MKKTVIFTLILAFSVCLFAQTHYFTGNGGKELKLAVLEPTGKGLTESEQWMLSLIQSSITGDFQRFSAMTIVDRQNVEKVMQDQYKALASGYYSDDDFVSIGNATNARLILTGVVSKTSNTYMLELSVTDAETHERKASYTPHSVTQATIEDLSAVKTASAEILSQLGVNLTDSGRQELLRPLAVNRIQAETALAQGIVAQRRGTEVTAQSYYRLASAFDPSLIEATNRSQIITSTINSSNIGENIRNDIRWR
jgi:hypothetical protein